MRAGEHVERGRERCPQRDISGETRIMRKLFVWTATAASLLAASANAYAVAVAVVPEIDAGGAAIAVGLIAGIVALIRERR